MGSQVRTKVRGLGQHIWLHGEAWENTIMCMVNIIYILKLCYALLRHDCGLLIVALTSICLAQDCHRGSLA